MKPVDLNQKIRRITNKECMIDLIRVEFAKTHAALKHEYSKWDSINGAVFMAVADELRRIERVTLKIIDKYPPEENYELD